jgi:hypothetical protein
LKFDFILTSHESSRLLSYVWIAFRVLKGEMMMMRRNKKLALGTGRNICHDAHLHNILMCIH